MEENKNLNDQLPEEEPKEETVSAPEAAIAPEAATAPEAAPAPEAVPEATPEAEPAPKKKKKKVGKILGIIAGVLALVIIASVLISVLSGNKDVTRGFFINEIGGTSETFTGAISERTFATAEQAAEEYVYTEIFDTRYGVNINSVTSHGTVDASGIIPAELLEGSDSVEKIEVNYSAPSIAALSEGPRTVSNNSENGTTVVYVVKFGDQWRYVTPAPIKGEALNKTYFNSVFESDKFRNCTLEFVENYKMGIFGFTLSETEVKWVIKLQDDRLYFEQTITDTGLLKDPDIVNCWYLEDSENGVLFYEKTDGGDWVYQPNYVLGFYGGAYIIDEVEDYTPFFDQLHFSHTLFNKTNYGFEVAEGKEREFFLDSYFWEEFTKLMRQESLYIYDEDVTVKDLYAEYFIQEGALTGVRTHSEIDFKTDVEGMEITFNYTDEYVAKITNYGTTVVERPNVN